MGCKARVERYSISKDGCEILTGVIRFPRIVIAETVTHRLGYDNTDGFEVAWTERTATRDVSKSSASSRAIPLSKMIEAVWKDPYVPPAFSIAGPGMQAAGYMDGEDQAENVSEWLELRNFAIRQALNMCSAAGQERVLADIGPAFRDLFGHNLRPKKKGVHKEMVNRVLEPWAWVTQIVTMSGSGISNFMALRCDDKAHPAFREVARRLYLAYRKATPTVLSFGQWHLPFVSPEEQRAFRWAPKMTSHMEPMPDMIQFSAARCAWVSYNNHDKDGSPEAMRNTFATLLGGWPKHGSPIEHQGTPYEFLLDEKASPYRSNLEGYMQARKFVPEEKISYYRPGPEVTSSWNISEPYWPED